MNSEFQLVTRAAYTHRQLIATLDTAIKIKGVDGLVGQVATMECGDTHRCTFAFVNGKLLVTVMGDRDDIEYSVSCELNEVGTGIEAVHFEFAYTEENINIVKKLPELIADAICEF